MIRYSQSFNGVSNDPNGTFTPSCIPPVVTGLSPTPIPSSYKYIKITGFDKGETILSCIPDSSGSPEIASESADGSKINLVDTSTVSINSCTIMCTQGTVVSPPTVTIQFVLSQKSTSGFQENQSSVPFQTSVTVRNF